MNKNIKTVFFILSLLLGKHSMYAQSSVGEWIDVPIASPSMASLAGFSDTPVSIQTGQPSIDIPLLTLPGNTGNFSYPLGISYNTLDIGNNISDVGSGWSLAAGGVIYKKVMGDLADESYIDASASYYKKNEFDDIYYYNLPGYAGKFMIKRDTIHDTFTLIKMTADNMKISYTRDNSITATLKIKNFTLTDDQGYQYFFNTVNVNRYKFPDDLFGAEYHSAFMLSEIKTPSGASVITFTYDKKDKYSVNTRLYEIYRLKGIKSRKGEVIFTQTYNETLEGSKNDPYTLEGITVKNPAGETVYSYAFNSSINASKRTLNFIEKKDKNGNATERTSFMYQDGKLEKVISPQGAVTQYEYEEGDVFSNRNDPDYLAGLESSLNFNPEIQYESDIFTNQVNTLSTTNYNFTIPGDVSKQKRFVFKLDISKNYNGNDLPTLPGAPKPPKNLKFVLKKNNQEIFTFVDYYNEKKALLLYPGSYTLQAVFDPDVSGVGTFTVAETKFLPPPYRNAQKVSDKRLKYVKYYSRINEAAPSKTIHYEYDSFDLPNSASGYSFDNEEGPVNSYILYRNVKVSETGLGSIRYSFGNPDDYPKQQVGGTSLQPVYFWPYYNVTKQGLMTRKEVYDEQNVLLSSESYTYEPDHYFNEEYDFTHGKIKSKTAYIKKAASVNKAFYADGGSLETASEKLINISNLKPSYIKNTADAEIFEQIITYAEGQPDYTHLVTANMTGVPIIVEEKKNGKTIAKKVTKFENLSLMPTSVYSASIADGNMRETLKMDAYDSQTNPVQISSGKGKTVAFIFGYDTTQVIAKIEGAQYDDVKNNPLVIAAIQASNNDNLNPATESTLITALENLRTHSSMAGYQITTYTCDPLVGLTTTTSPNGQRELYEYDSAGRLKKVKGAERNNAGSIVEKTLKEYEYHYKP
ncbi:RHS repeat domain-containing protein [Chryseobacterium sp. POE27]|uniref:RHS repeat domain-containing protein n=1 Tax=Chryseobacterium sp. POE27 TaxID=3138177 RepID=UPI00321A0F1F